MSTLYPYPTVPAPTGHLDVRPADLATLLPAAAHSDTRVEPSLPLATPAQTASRLQAMLRAGLFTHHGPVYAVYRMSSRDHCQTGLVAEVAVADYQRGRIRRHEHTQPEAERRLASSLDTVQAELSPVGLTYRGSPALDQLAGQLASEAPALRLTAADGVEHTVWIVDPHHADALRAALATIDRLYITDGHHRLAAAARHAARCRDDNPAHTGAEPYNFVLAALFPQDQMRVLGYHRCVAGLSGPAGQDNPATRSLLEAIARQPGVHSIAPSSREAVEYTTPGCCAAFVDGTWYRIRFSSETGHGTVPPDAVMLQQHVLAPVLGIADPEADPRLDHVPGTASFDPALLEQRCGGRDEIAFVLHPPSVGDVLGVSDAGLVLPPKSTWFTPKPQPGIFLRFTHSDRQRSRP